MITKSKSLFEKVAQKHSLPAEALASVGNCVFEELRRKMESPEELAYELPRLGTFNVRFTTFERYFTNFLRKLQEGSETAQEQLKTNPKLFQQNADLYKKIQVYREDKQKTKLKRHEQTNQSGENNPA